MDTTKNNGLLFLLGGIIIGLLISPILFPMMGFGSMMGWRNERVSPRMGQGVTGSIDRHFIEQMIPHHEGAIAMAELALQKSSRREITTLAQAIIAAQTQENLTMRMWYEDWFGTDVPPQGFAMMGGMMSQGGMHMGGREDLTALSVAEDFDKEFIEQMIPHHQMAIMMARMLESGTSRPEMQGLAEDIIESQSKEIEEMRGWYETWY